MVATPATCVGVPKGAAAAAALLALSSAAQEPHLRHLQKRQWLAALLGSSALQKDAQPSSLVSPASPEEQVGWDGALTFGVATCATFGLPATATAHQPCGPPALSLP